MSVRNHMPKIKLIWGADRVWYHTKTYTEVETGERIEIRSDDVELTGLVIAMEKVIRDHVFNWIIELVEMRKKENVEMLWSILREADKKYFKDNLDIGDFSNEKDAIWFIQNVDQ